MTLAGLRLMPHFDTSPRLVSWVQTLPGKLSLVLALTLLLLLDFGKQALPMDIALVILLTTLLPGRRRPLISLAALAWVLLGRIRAEPIIVYLFQRTRTPMPENFVPAVVLLVLLFAGGCYLVVRRFPRSLLARHPVACLAIFLLGLHVVISELPFHDARLLLLLCAFVSVLGSYLWFISYGLVDAQSANKVPFHLQVGSFYPFWAVTPTPLPKGPGYLSRIEARTPEDLAVTQLKGMNLLLWALVIKVFKAGFDHVVFGAVTSLDSWLLSLPSLDLPFLQRLIASPEYGARFPIYVRWASLVGHFIDQLLLLAVWSHAAVAICRLAGFRALRNTYNPLISTTIAEFYNRVFFYFKELLVEFFFYPTYLRFFKGSPRFRIFFATLASAGFGNFLYHFLCDEAVLYRFGIWHALVRFQSYALYCLILGLGIGLSQVLNRGRRERPTGLRAFRASFLVFLFYCLATTLDDGTRTLTVAQCSWFWLKLITP